MFKFISKYIKDFLIVILLLDVAFSQYQLYQCQKQNNVIEAPMLEKELREYLDQRDADKAEEVPFKKQVVPSE